MEIKETYQKLLQINKLFGNMIDFKIFTSCVGTSEKFEDLLLVDMDWLDHCLSSVFFEPGTRGPPGLAISWVMEERWTPFQLH